MTFGFLLSEGCTDLNGIFQIDGEACTFDHQLSVGYGHLGEHTYKMTNGIKQLFKRDDKYYAQTHQGDLIRLLSLHFQGGSKNFLLQFQ